MGSGEDRRPLLLGAADVAALLDLDTGLASQREAFTRLGRGEADQPARLVLPVAGDDSLAFCYAARLAPGSGAVSKFGSVNPGNAAELVAQPHIDGLFIGRSAWDPEGYIDILKRVAAALPNGGRP